MSFERSLTTSKTHGLRVPIAVYDDQILDGRNRYHACKMAGVEPRFTTPKLANDEEALMYVRSANLKRRDLTPTQKADITLDIEGLLLKLRRQAKMCVIEGGRQGGLMAGRGRPKALPSRDGSPIEVTTPERGPSTNDKLAKVAGVGRTTIERVLHVRKHGSPEQQKAMRDGTKSATEVCREITKASRPRVALPKGKYRVLYADPPWKYANAGAIGEGDNYGRVERHYPTMSVQELCALDIKSLAHRDAVLFLWVTAPLVFETAPAVIDAWGFKYKAMIIWDKERGVFGHYVSVRHELLLICTRGSCTPDRPTPMPPSIIRVPKSGKHSEKPEEFRRIIEQLYDGPYIELFARKKVPGWTTWGNEPKQVSA